MNRLKRIFLIIWSVYLVLVIAVYLAGELSTFGFALQGLVAIFGIFSLIADKTFGKSGANKHL